MSFSTSHPPDEYSTMLSKSSFNQNGGFKNSINKKSENEKGCKKCKEKRASGILADSTVGLKVFISKPPWLSL